jgi:hypothetical protein
MDEILQGFVAKRSVLDFIELIKDSKNLFSYGKKEVFMIIFVIYIIKLGSYIIYFKYKFNLI